MFIYEEYNDGDPFGERDVFYAETFEEAEAYLKARVIKAVVKKKKNPTYEDAVRIGKRKDPEAVFEDGYVSYAPDDGDVTFFQIFEPARVPKVETE